MNSDLEMNHLRKLLDYYVKIARMFKAICNSMFVFFYLFYPIKIIYSLFKLNHRFFFELNAKREFVILLFKECKIIN